MLLNFIIQGPPNIQVGLLQLKQFFTIVETWVTMVMYLITALHHHYFENNLVYVSIVCQMQSNTKTITLHWWLLAFVHLTVHIKKQWVFWDQKEWTWLCIFYKSVYFSKRLYHLVYIHHRENIPPQRFACPFFSKGKWKLMTQGKMASCCRGQNSVPLANNMSEELENMWINFSAFNPLLFILKYNAKC